MTFKRALYARPWLPASDSPDCSAAASRLPPPIPDHSAMHRTGHPAGRTTTNHNNNQWGNADNRGGNPAPGDWQNRETDQGRQDHQPFNWNGQQVTPMPAEYGAGWGFWFLGMWIPL